MAHPATLGFGHPVPQIAAPDLDDPVVEQHRVFRVEVERPVDPLGGVPLLLLAFSVELQQRLARRVIFPGKTGLGLAVELPLGLLDWQRVAIGRRHGFGPLRLRLFPQIWGGGDKTPAQGAPARRGLAPVPVRSHRRHWAALLRSCPSLRSAAAPCRRARLIAAPRISPRLAPESDEPNSAIARFSSSTSLALIDSVILRVARSIVVILASTFSPTANRSGRCSLRSRDSSDLRIKPSTPSPTVTSMPPSVTPATVPVTTSPRRNLARLASNGSASSCLMPRLMRSFSTSTSSTLARTTSPL